MSSSAYVPGLATTILLEKTAARETTFVTSNVSY